LEEGEFTVDGKVDAQPLYLSQVAINAANENVLYVATEHGSVYAFDADSINGTIPTFLWKTSTLGAVKPPAILAAAARFRRKLASPRRRSSIGLAMPSTSSPCRKMPAEVISSACMR